MPIKFTLVLFLSLLFFSSFAQTHQTFLSLNNDLYSRVEFALANEDSAILFHSSCKPYLNSKLFSFCNPDSLFEIKLCGHRPQKNIIAEGWYNLKNDHFININQDILHLTIDPAIDFAAGPDVSDNVTLFTNTRGAEVNGDIGNKFSFNTNFYENQSGFPDYLTAFGKDSSIIPGQGRVKKFKIRSFDYQHASGYVSYSPSKYVNFQFGQDKNFIGDGYRSLLLSDNAYSYPFVKITTQVGRFQYMNLYTQMLDIRSRVIYNAGFQKKYGAFHYLDYVFGNNFLEAGLFEGVIWEGSDSTHYRGYDLDYLNPVIFYHAVQFGLGSPDNSVIGANVRCNPVKQLTLYGQLLIDDFDLGRSKTQKGFYRNKYAFQLGAKYLNAFGVKNLLLESEFNQVWPYTYAQKIITQNYAHYNQSLADPLGANFRESVNIISYRYKRFFAEGEFLYSLIGLDNDTSHVGHNIYVSDFDIPGAYDAQGNFVGTYGNYVGQGIKTNLMYAQLRVAFLINPKINLNLELIGVHRTVTSVVQNEELNYFTIGLRTNLFNKYYDF